MATIWYGYHSHSEKKLKALRSDHCPEFTSYAFEKFLKERGNDHDFSIAFHPPQNGVAERFNRTLEEKTRTMLITAQLPVSYWEYAMKYATWIIDRSATSRQLNDKLTPYEAWIGRKANLAGAHTFGCMAVRLIAKIKRDHKLSPIKEWLLFLSMSEDHKAWPLVNPENGKEVRSAAFHEDKWLKTWRMERKKEALDTQAFVERGKEIAPPQKTFGDLLRSQLTT